MSRAHALWITASLFGALAVPGCSTKPVGQLVLVVQTDLALPKDIDSIRIEVTSDGVPKFDDTYTRLGSTDGEIHLPGTLSLVGSSDSASTADIIVSARSGSKVRIVTEVVTTIPTDRAATMQLPLQFLCDGQGKMQGASAASTCPGGQSCLAGACKTSSVDSSALPTYDPGSVFGDGTCFDVSRCFDDLTIADVDMGGCTFHPASTEVNVALETEGDGICGAVGCFVALDANAPLGWQVLPSGSIQLPPAVCPKLASGVVVHVVTSPLTSECRQKSVSLPTCGPWSTATDAPPPYTGPIALAGGQSHPSSLVFTGPPNDRSIAWTNAGTAGVADGAVKTVLIGGGTPASVASATAARDITTDAGGTIYWTSATTPGQGQISVQASPSVDVLVSHLGEPEGIAVFGDQLFWTDFESSSIFSAPLSGVGPGPIATGNYPYRIVADGRYVYWTNEGTAGMTPPDGSVARYDAINPGPAALQTLATAEDTPRAIALELDGTGLATAVYWANFAAHGQLVRLDLATSTTVVLVSDLAYPNGIAVDDATVYWSNRGDGTIQSLPRGANPGDPPATLATGQAAPGAMLVDDGAIYWINAGPSTVSQGAIVKLAKAQ